MQKKNHIMKYLLKRNAQVKVNTSMVIWYWARAMCYSSTATINIIDVLVPPVRLCYSFCYSSGWITNGETKLAEVVQAGCFRFRSWCSCCWYWSTWICLKRIGQWIRKDFVDVLIFIWIISFANNRIFDGRNVNTFIVSENHLISGKNNYYLLIRLNAISGIIQLLNIPKPKKTN